MQIHDTHMERSPHPPHLRPIHTEAGGDGAGQLSPTGTHKHSIADVSMVRMCGGCQVAVWDWNLVLAHRRMGVASVPLKDFAHGTITSSLTVPHQHPCGCQLAIFDHWGILA